MIPRLVAARLHHALETRPVVLLHGARQTGKTTLARQVAADRGATYVTFDDRTPLVAATADPEGFIHGFEGPVVIDEVQRAPGVLPAIKATVDRRRTAGRFLLTGSANILQLPRIADSLAGRMEIVTLWPLSEREIERSSGNFIDALFAPRFSGTRTVRLSQAPLLGRVLRGGYPEVVQIKSVDDRHRWFESYLTAMIARDARDLKRISDVAQLGRLMALASARTGSLVNISEIGRALGANVMTTRRYLSLLSMMFLVREVQPWHANIAKRLVKTPKLHVCDTGLAAHLAGIDAERLKRDPSLIGGLLESFVVTELLKQLDSSASQPSLYHFRTAKGDEVDIVLEQRSGALVGIEVTHASSLGDSATRGMRALAEAAGKRFHRGVIFYNGTQTVPLAANIRAVPFPALWSAC